MAAAGKGLSPPGRRERPGDPATLVMPLVAAEYRRSPEVGPRTAEGIMDGDGITWRRDKTEEPGEGNTAPPAEELQADPRDTPLSVS